MIRAIITILLLGLLCGCSTLTTYSEVYDFSQGEWSGDKRVSFEFCPTTTISSSEVLLTLRYDRTVSNTPVVLYVKTQNGDMLYTVDSLSFTLPRGYGSQLRSVTIPYRENIYWQSLNNHAMTIWPKSDLQHVLSVSIEVDNAQKI